MYRVLINHEGGSFPAENVHFLKGSQATLANIRRELEEWLPSVAQPADRVVVYFAGHGFVQNGKGYLAPWDVDPEQLDVDRLSDDGARRRAGHKVKAELESAAHRRVPLRQDQRRDHQRSARSSSSARCPASFLTLTATTEREQSFEDPNLATGFGFFTYYLVQAFSGYADNDPCDGRITADELIEYVRIERAALRPRTPALANADRARRLRARDAARRRPRLPVGRHQGALDARHGRDRNQHGRRRRLHRRRADREGQKSKPLVVPSLPSGPPRVPGREGRLRARSQGSDDRAGPGSRRSRCGSATCGRSRSRRSR